MATAKAQGVVLELSNEEARALLRVARYLRQDVPQDIVVNVLNKEAMREIEDALLSEIGAYECE